MRKKATIEFKKIRVTSFRSLKVIRVLKWCERKKLKIFKNARFLSFKGLKFSKSCERKIIELIN